MDAYEGSLVLITLAVIIIGVFKISAKMSKWDTLASSFPPSHTSSRVLKEYRNESGFVGNMELDSNLTVRVKKEGMELHLMNPFMPDLFIHWERFSKVEVDTTDGKTFLNFTLSHPAHLNFRLPKEVSQYIEGKIPEEKFEKGMEIESVGDLFSFVKEASKKKRP